MERRCGAHQARFVDDLGLAMGYVEGARWDRCCQPIERFVGDKAAYEFLRDHQDLGETGKSMLKRHCFRKVSVRQLSLAMDDPGFGTDQWWQDL